MLSLLYKVSGMINPPKVSKKMKQFQVFQILILILITTSSTEDLDYAKEGCNDTCGDVRIPYPFGIGANCSVNKWYVVECNSSTPYLSAFNNIEVLGVGLEKQTVTVNVSVTSSCPTSNLIPSINLGESPFVFSRLHNTLTVEGCGHAVILDEGKVITGCSTTCTNDTTSERDHCFGLSCCQNTIPYNLKSYSVDLTGLKRLGEDGACGYAFLGNMEWLDGVFEDNKQLRTSFRKAKTRNTSFIPITLVWFLTNIDFHEIPNCWERQGRAPVLDLGNGRYIPSRKCSCGIGRVGNPYLHYQCQGIMSPKFPS
ncbi:putative wall-associated receptor kinase, galacturonan-binding domain-containing protein [Helianthus anomalus]